MRFFGTKRAAISSRSSLVAPFNLVVSQQYPDYPSESFLLLDFSTVGNTPPYDIYIERSTDGISFTPLVNFTALTTSAHYQYGDGSSAYSVVYYYRVRTKRGGVFSSYSNIASGVAFLASAPHTPQDIPWNDGDMPPDTGYVPWRVGFYDGSTFLGCGGVLLDNQTVLTSASAAFALENVAKPAVKGGDIYVAMAGGNVQSSEFTSIEYHPSWKPSTHVADLAIVFLKAPFTLGTYVNSIPYAGVDEGNYPVEKNQGVLAMLQYSGGSPTVVDLTEGVGSRLSTSDANAYLTGVLTVTSDMIPLKHSTPTATEAGAGLTTVDDFGVFYTIGPLTLAPTSVDTVSVYTKAASYNTWIHLTSGIAPYF